MALDIIANCINIMNNFKREESNELNNNFYNIITDPNLIFIPIPKNTKNCTYRLWTNNVDNIILPTRFLDRDICNSERSSGTILSKNCFTFNYIFYSIPDCYVNPLWPCKNEKTRYCTLSV